MDSGDWQVIPQENVRLHTGTARVLPNLMNVKPELALDLPSRNVFSNRWVWSW